jgi:transketolase
MSAALVPPARSWEAQKAPFAVALLELARKRKDVVVLSADLSKYTDILPFAETYPDRFFQVGMAEANMMGIAGGLAKRGLLPIAVTYGVFATRRAYDQLAMALTTGPSRGIVVAFLPGITTPFRATHQAIDDVALMRALPGVAVVDPCDGSELALALFEAARRERTTYIRGLRGEVDAIFSSAVVTSLETARIVADGPAGAVISTGLGTKWALEAAELGAQTGQGFDVLHAPTLKPIDQESVASFAREHSHIWTIENHSTTGGLGSAVAEVIAANGIACRLETLGVPDVWAPAGSVDYIRAELGLDAAALARRIGNVR